jgi:hypothetical protein
MVKPKDCYKCCFSGIEGDHLACCREKIVIDAQSVACRNWHPERDAGGVYEKQKQEILTGKKAVPLYMYCEHFKKKRQEMSTPCRKEKSPRCLKCPYLPKMYQGERLAFRYG